MKKILAAAAMCSMVMAAGSVSAGTLTPIEQLGMELYESNLLSKNETQSCATCHNADTGFADLFNSVVSLGDNGFSTGGRNAPTSAYAGFSPVLHMNADGEYVGGMFWDGRATGWTLGDPLAEQAQGPPLNPVEMGMESIEAIFAALATNLDIVTDYKVVFDDDPFTDPSTADLTLAYDNIAKAIAAYERSSEVTQFTSEFDYNQSLKGKNKFAGDQVPLMSEGEWLFRQNCTTCHAMGQHGSGHALFTNHKYVNAGVPVNPKLEEDPYCAYEYPDNGLGGFLETVKNTDGSYVYPDYAEQYGKFKVPTLRNITLTAPYSHNGYFATLEAMVYFMNDRNTVYECDENGENCLAEAEVADNLSAEVGNLGLTVDQCDKIVTFLYTLEDGFYDPDAQP